MRKNQTRKQYDAIYAAYDLLNQKLFGGKLPPVIITFQHLKRSRGYYCTNMYKHKINGKVVAEISMDSESIQRPDRVALSTLLHEMCHHKQYTDKDGKPSRNGYHNRQFSVMMENVGLMTSHDGKPGGKRTGQRMTHYIIENGPFDRLFKVIKKSGFKFHYCYNGAPIAADGDPGDDAEKPKNRKIKYECPGCSAKVWGKPELAIACIDCDEEFQSQD